MIENLYIPKLGMTMEKATIAEWKFKNGDQVKQNDVVLVIDTEKVAHEIEAPIGGFLLILANVGEEHPCGAIIGKIAETKQEYESIKNEVPAGASAPMTGSEETKLKKHAAPMQPSDKPQSRDRILISPLARKFAEGKNIDLSKVRGSGPGGRIIKEDIEKAMASQPEKVEAGTTPAVPATASPKTIIDGKRIKEVIPLKGMRKAISDHMHHSLQVSARVTAFSEVDMTKIIELRNRYLKKSEILGFRITYTDFFILMAAKALKSVPIMNSSLIGDEIKIWEDINIGFAASVVDKNQSGLVVPVIHNADTLSLGQISRKRKELTDKARTGKLSLDEMVGGTFTITNTGTFTPIWHIQTPIINQPQAAILGTSSIVDKPVVIDGQIVIRPMMPISFAFDHRIMDGAPPAQFINKLAEMIDDPDMIIM